MTVETSTYISSLNTSLPAGGDQKAEGDDHIRLLKSNLKSTFPNITGAVTPTHTELNYVAGVTSALQTQINGKLNSASPVFTGNATFGGTATGITDLTTSGNTVLGDATTDTLAVGVNGIVKDSSGNVGIGTTGPLANLDLLRNSANTSFYVRSASGFTSVIEVAGNGTGAGSGSLALQQDSSSVGYVYQRSNAALNFGTNNTLRMTITAAGVIQDGSANELGFKGLPAASVTTGAFVAADRGKCVNASGGVTVPNSTMSATDVVYIDNQSGGAITITATITTLKLAGTSSTGNRTLAADGFATVRFRSGTVAVISGPGVS